VTWSLHRAFCKKKQSTTDNSVTNISSLSLPIKGFIADSLSAINTLIGTLQPHSNGPQYSNTVIGTLAVDG